MRILVVGAGATGGYYGGRLAEAGRDVTFLVRRTRSRTLADRGLSIRSPLGDFVIGSPKTVTADLLKPGEAPFDLVIMSCKAYDLGQALADVAPAVTERTLVLPILNGLSHLEALDRAFGAGRVLGGCCHIASMVGEAGEILHLGEHCTLTYGQRGGIRQDRVSELDAAMQGGKFRARLSDDIVLEMWEKWVFLASIAGATTIMRSTVGGIVAAPGGRAFIVALHEECLAVAEANARAPRAEVSAQARATLTAAASPLTTSMLRDMLADRGVEADHVFGELIERGRTAGVRARLPLLNAVYSQLKIYERRRAGIQADGEVPGVPPQPATIARPTST
ncbi:2-dehydropantoate 2-reductase [Methylobacterium sp. J-070]|uniref:2-dehydropantoate 2-reductase n=1 Tax=Methylobacterium sp. J-070 TaxID=2836650 RepID=UPI001FBC1144|nr:2-dehydropantoate 2-reductase [Methylobacterium sp. J-070]MCJ2048945.1 2-dehydropantoate 2-reductase [Methylobacterium sp. J-070]